MTGKIGHEDPPDPPPLDGVEQAAKGWDFRVVLSVDLAGAGPRFRDYSEGLGAEGGEVFQAQIRSFIGNALAEARADEGVWQWAGDGALLAFADAGRAHDFAVGLHRATGVHNQAATTSETQRHFRVGMAATDNPRRESWNYTVTRAVRLESQADTDGILVDVETWTGLHSTTRSLYSPVEQVPGKRDDESYGAHRYKPESEPKKPETPANPRLNNLPPDVAHFQGRGAEETALLRALKGGGGTQAITALKGIGGIGKSALAVRVARQLLRHYPAAQILVNLRGTDADPLSPRGAMEEVIRRFEPGAQLPDDDSAVAEIYRGILVQHKSLLILDNAGDGAQVQTLLPPPPSAAIITSRRQVDLPAVVSHGLDNLGRGDAIALLAELFAERAPAKVPDTGALELLAAACSDHPLALTVAGIYAANRADTITVERYAGQIVERRETLKLQGIADHDVMASLGLSLERLAAEDAKLAERWRDLAVFPADFDAAAAAAVWADAAGADAVSEILVGLTDASFLEPGSARGRFRLHDLMRDLARINQSAGRFTAAKARHGAYFVIVLSVAKELYKKGGAHNVLAGMALFDLEQANIRTGQARAVAAMKEEASAAAGALVYQYGNAGAYVLNLRLHPRDLITWWAEAVEGALLSADRGGEGAALSNLGLAYADFGEMDKAIDHYQHALVIFREIGYRGGEEGALGNLGSAYYGLGETNKAIDHYEKALVISREIGDLRGEGNSLTGLGIAYADLGETDEAIDHDEQALVISREIGDRRGEGAALGNLGSVYADLGETDKAVDNYQQQLVITREIGDRLSEGIALSNLGVAYELLKRFAEARAAGTASLALFAAIDNPNAERVREWLARLE